LQVKFTSKGATLVVTIIGELDHHSAEYIRQKIDSEIIKSTTKNIIFDFSKLEFMDSSGIGVIMGRFRNIQKLNGKMAAVNVSSRIQRILDMSWLSKILPVCENIEGALNIL